MLTQRILHYQLSRIGKVVLTLCCGLMVVLIGVIHFVTGEDLIPYALYLVPQVIVSWYVGLGAAFFILFLCGASWLMVELRLAPFEIHLITNELIRATVYLLLILSIAQLRAALTREIKLARVDGLTGLLNRRAFYEACQREIMRAKRYQRPLSVMMIDLDNFKQVNDRLGHAAGDKLLMAVSHSLRHETRSTDIPGRLGGDEFAILLPETDKASAHMIANKLRDSMLQDIQAQQWPVTLSIGVAAYENPPDNVDRLIKHADDLMYAVKQSGKNGIRCESFSAGE